MIKLIIHIVIAFSVFFSSSGFWVNSHYCQNELAKTSFFFGFGSCCEGESSNACTVEKMVCNKDGHEEGEGCCHNKPSFHKIDQNQLIQEAEFKSFDHPVVSNAIIPATNIELPSIDKLTLRYLNYLPPLIVYDRQVRLQTFLC